MDVSQESPDAGHGGTPSRARAATGQHVDVALGPLRAPARASAPAANPLRFANRVLRLPRSVPNHRRLARQQRPEADWAILDGEAHDRSLLLECLDLAGNTVAAGEGALGWNECHHAAKRLETDRQGA